MKVNLLGLDAASLAAFFATLGEKPFRARQVMRWVHQRREDDFARMTDLAKDLRAKLQAHAVVRAPAIVGDSTAADGTRKWLLKVDGANAVDAVFIPSPRAARCACPARRAACSTARSARPASRASTAT
jgi:23S rRNA (adenine2503-C2)-methyltransferase